MATPLATASTRGRPPGAWQNQLPSDLFESGVYCSLSALQRLLLVTLIARADRHGRGLARPSQLRVAAFDGLNVSEEETASLLAALAGQVRGSRYELLVYEIDRDQYYCFPRWREWQNIDYVPKVSRFPPPPGTDDEPSTPPQGNSPRGSADLPAGAGGAAGVPTSGAAPANTQGRDDHGRQEPPTAQGSADLPAIERARRSPEYREYEETCRAAHLDTWVTFTAFEQFFGALLNTGREWTVLLEVVREAINSASGKPPNVKYGLRIIHELPPDIKTRQQAELYFRAKQAGKPPDQGSGRSSNVILRRGKKDESDYDYIYKRFDDGPKVVN